MLDLHLLQASTFFSLDIRVGEIKTVERFEGLIKPAFKLMVDCGQEIGLLNTSAQITELYSEQNLIGKHVLVVINLKPKQIKNFISQCLVIGVYSKEGVVLVVPDKRCAIGDKLG